MRKPIPAAETACDWCGGGDHDPIKPRDGE
jgi:hypothetical protein